MLRYYPSSKVVTNLTTSGKEFVGQDGSPYSGKYYLTYDGKAFSGPSPEVGPSNPLNRIPSYPTAPGLNALTLTEKQKKNLAVKTGISLSRIQGKPVSYYPQPVASDYKKGYVIRYFTKRENEKGFITEISENEYNSIVNGTADYDISIYQTTKILWKLTGPLRNQRQSQYNVIPGIIDTNQRLTETANKTFLGIVDFIGGDYAKFARPTA
jgi:hypothetical protein